MNITLIILGLIVIVNAMFIARLAFDVIKNKQELLKESGNKLLLAICPAITFFLSSFGASDYAISTVLYRKFKLISDEKLPGTLNTQCVIPISLMALAFISVVEVDIATLVICIVAQVLGAYVGPRFVVKLSPTIIRKCIGFGLLTACAFILAGKFGVIPSDGDALGLSGLELVIAAICLFTFGALNNIGIGSFAPTMATIYALGMNPATAFPIMMGACAFSVPVGSMQFIKYGAYSRKITLYTAIFGSLGVFCAVFLVKELDVSLLQWVIAGILIYTGAGLLIGEFKKNKIFDEIEVKAN
jgi:uncharacterized membrane protein YfcA